MITRHFLLIFCVSAFGLGGAFAASQVNIGDDDAEQGIYNAAWRDGTGGDNGFFPWKIVTKTDGEGSFAGNYLAKKSEKPEVAPIATDRAFAMFANGKSYEEVVAFRGVSVPLEAGDNFSFDIAHGPFVAKSDQDAATPSEVGVTYRTGNANEAIGDWATGARLKFFAREGSPNYFIGDAEKEFDTGIPITTEVVALTLTIVDKDTYDLEVINLKDQSVKLFEKRKFGGEGGGSINSVAFFNRNAETHDFCFNNFQLMRNAP
jgi:hypothetical protein